MVILQTQYVVFPKSNAPTEGDEGLEEEQFEGITEPIQVHIEEETEAKLDEWVRHCYVSTQTFLSRMLLCLA